MELAIEVLYWALILMLVWELTGLLYDWLERNDRRD